ncbi:DUF453-domain-containing protein [Annulohypoxylon maeteangense]|uniref:DUF453-domain-containing protein n=1 Tax=Annulohypoxylon maeteangense TaxID=1927788 RepID=UPI002007BA85|nr:DUF453-domain-containing protein [Annulohypoxylon maeteangense]KAI0887433.1 DUF453-domain-containing protein [Annulohypoxylon maeteangense]
MRPLITRALRRTLHTSPAAGSRAPKTPPPPASADTNTYTTPTSTPTPANRSFPALFVRGGTSNGLIIQRQHLPPQTQWPSILAPAMGSPDPYGRQLNGIGGGVSSTSKICVISPSSRADADIDFTFVQVVIQSGALDLAGNCGNMSAAVGPVAWDLGLVKPPLTDTVAEQEREGKGKGEREREALVRIFNTNTSKLIHSTFPLTPSSPSSPSSPPKYQPHGTYAIAGVPGTQSLIKLSFLDPAGAKTGAALPTGNAIDTLTLSDGSQVEASLVDISNPGVFIRVRDLGSEFRDADPTTLTPQVVEADAALKGRLEAIRRAGAVAMGLDPTTESVPKIVLLFPSPESADTDVDLRCLALSMGQAHKAVPLTLALCLGAAANIPGTLPAQVRGAKGGDEGRPVVIGHPSGTVEIGATFKDGRIVSADLLRTARVLMKGDVYY